MLDEASTVNGNGRIKEIGIQTFTVEFFKLRWIFEIFHNKMLKKKGNRKAIAAWNSRVRTVGLGDLHTSLHC